MEKGAHNRKRKFSPRPRKEEGLEPKKFFADGRTLDIEPLRPGARSNFVTWRRNLEIQIGERFGEFQKIFTAEGPDGAYPRNIRPEPDEARLATDPFQLYRNECTKKLEMFLKKEEEIEETKTKVYHYIKKHMTPESWEEAKRDPEWSAENANVELLREPFLLFQAVKRTHSGHRTGIETLDIENAEMSYQNIRQLPNQTLLAYKDYFDHRVNTLATLGLAVPSAEQQAIKFIRGLDDARYSDLKLHFYNHARAGTGDYPKTVVLAYNIATNHFQKAKSKFTNQGVAYIAENGRGKHKQTLKQNSNQKKQPYCRVHKSNDHWTSECPCVDDMIASLEQESDGTKIAASATTVKPSNGKTVRVKGFTTILHSDFTDKARYNNFEPTNRDIILDTGATACIVKEKSLLKNIRKVRNVARIKGVNSEDLCTVYIGDLPYFGEAWYHPKAVANLIPFGRLEKNHNVNYERNFRFHFKAEDGTEINFFKVEEDSEGNGLYVFNPDTKDFIAAITTVEQNKLGYSKREVRDAIVAREFIRRMGYPSIRDAIELLESGSIVNCPVTVQDIVRAQNIFGTDIGILKGKMTHKKSDPVNLSHLPKLTGVSIFQALNTDIMFVDGMPYLITISQPLNLLMVKSLEGRRDKEAIEEALIKIIRQYRARGFSIERVLCDGEKGVAACADLLNAEGIELNISSAGQHVPVIERAIRQIKERIRAIVTTLPYILPNKLMPYLVDYCVMAINMFPKSKSLDKISPREHFTGRKINYKKDMRVTFGEYAQCAIPNIISRDARQPRTEGAIALIPTGNLQGSVLFYILGTGSIVAREHFTVLPMPKEVIDKMNDLSKGRNIKGNKDIIISLDESDEEEFIEDKDLNDREIEKYLPPVRENVPIQEEGLNLEPEYEKDYTEGVISQLDTTPPPDVPDESTHAMNLRPNPKQTDWLVLNVSIQQALERNPQPTLKALLKELKQMRDKGVFLPVLKERLSNQQLRKVVRSFLFLKEKFKADGSFDKWKGRLCVLGNLQTEIFLDPASPTASLTAVFIVAAIAAKEKRHVVTLDVPGAYLNATMEEEVLMSLEPLLASLLVALAPEFKPYIDEKGMLIVRLQKALYGLHESAKLWYGTISKMLIEEGFNPNPIEPCVFNKLVNDVQCTICLYVDDLMITCADEKILDEVINLLESKYEGAKASKSKVHSYLGMMFDFSTEEQVKITMEGYIQDILKTYDVKGKANTPALTNLFEVSESPLLDEERKTKFHSIVAKLLYLAKRVRPDILTTVSYLATRVTKSTEDDWKKLDRLLRYVNYDPNSGIVLRPGNEDIHIKAYADASYGIHEDAKSHSGLCIALGSGPIFVKSAKQKIVSKSSTEAELISLSDGCSQIIWSRDFLIAQGYNLPAATIYQDNTSTIALVERGKSSSERTKHINIRYYFIKDRIESGEIEIKHLPTDMMIADIFTKPLVGERFRQLKAKLLNWYF